jgi:hypothetical protein
MLITRDNEFETKEFKRSMMRKFVMIDLGELSYFLGIEFQRTKGWTIVTQL